MSQRQPCGNIEVKPKLVDTDFDRKKDASGRFIGAPPPAAQRGRVLRQVETTGAQYRLRVRQRIEQNVRDTKEIVEFGHQHGVWVQGEIGRLPRSEDLVSVSDAEALLTDPHDALRFWKATGVDTLACSVGTVHGIIKIRGGVQPHVDLHRIKEINDIVHIPLVLHGASGVAEHTISDAIENGISIINIDTELRIAFADALREYLAGNAEEIDPRRILGPTIEAVRKTAEAKRVSRPRKPDSRGR